MLWFSKSVDVRRLKRMCPDANLMIAHLHGAFGSEDEALVATFPTPEDEAYALMKLRCDEGLKDEVVVEAKN